MKLTRFLAITTIAASFGLNVVQAQSINSNELPAEFPPADFTGKQFVDSRGCVYIRAGVDGATTWVPRVTRDRKVICGFKPTFDPSQTAATSAAPKLDKNVVQIQPAAPETSGTVAAAPAVVAPAATTSTARTTAPRTTSVSTPKATTTARPQTTSTAPTVIVPAQPAPKAAAAPVVTTAPSAAPAPTTQTQRRATSQPPRAAGVVSPCREGVSSWKGSSIRCGPQAQSPVTPGTGSPTAQPPQMRFDQNSSLRRPAAGTVVRVGEVAPDVRVVPRHVYEANQHTQVSQIVPEGYRRAFEDGRLNERRAEMTLAGQAQMAQIWTESLPRQLVDTPSPDADEVAQARTTVTNASTVSTKSEPAAKSLRLAGTPYVQVGTFADADSAHAAAKQIQRMGLPVRIGRFDRDGVTQRMVLAGPFADVDGAETALSRAQGAGFSGAFVRQ